MRKRNSGLKSFCTGCIALLLSTGLASATTHTITNSGFTFSPSNVTIELGDTVRFTLTLDHNAVEVSQSTWNANGSTLLAGGFIRPYGGGIVVLTTTGTHYYVCSPHADGGMKGRITVNPVTDVGPTGDGTPDKFSLAQNYPNPFNPSTEIAFFIARSSLTLIAVYDGIGRRVKTLVSGDLAPGEYVATWDGSDERGAQAGSGPYFVRMTARNDEKDFFTVRRILLVR